MTEILRRIIGQLDGTNALFLMYTKRNTYDAEAAAWVLIEKLPKWESVYGYMGGLVMYGGRERTPLS